LGQHKHREALEAVLSYFNMRYRGLNPSDIIELQRIHEKFYKEEFELPDFFKGFLSSFVVTDDEDSPIIIGGVRSIAESVILTNKDMSASDRREALYGALKISIFSSSRFGFNQLHAFIQDEKWLNHLKKVGFKETVGKSIVLNL